VVDTRNSDKTYAAGDVIGFYAPFGTSDPGNMNALSSPWICLGWLADGGTIFKLDETMKNITAAGTLDPIRTIVTGAPKTVECTFQEGLNPAIRSLYDDVPLLTLQPAPNTTIVRYPMPEIPPNNSYAFVWDSFDEDGAQLRNYCPQGKVTSRGNDQAQMSDATTIQLTFTFYPQLVQDVRTAMVRYINYGSADTTPFFA
jgi:hypothetical protein